MKKLSEYLGKQIVNLAAAKEEGVIINGILDDRLKKISCFVVVNEESYDEIELLLPIKAVIHGADILYIKDAKFVEQLPPQFIKSPLNARVFNTDGESVGIVKDISFDDKGYIQALILEDREILQSEILIATSSIVTVKGISKLRIARKKPQEVPEVKKMMNIPIQVQNIQNETAASEQEPSEDELPPRIITDYTFLLGRKVTKNIRSAGEIIILENTVIDDSVVKTARHNGKLVELTINSK